MKIIEYQINQLVRLLPDALVSVSAALKESIAQHGVLVPPVVCAGVVCDGHRRLAACRHTGIKTIACLETTGVAGLLFAELNSQRELNAFEAAAVFVRLNTTEQTIFLNQVGMSESPQMRLALQYIADHILTRPELLSHTLPINVWRELAHLGDAMHRFAAPLLLLQGTAAEKRNIAALLRQAQRRNELPENLPGNNATEVLQKMQKISQPRRSEALARFEAVLATSELPAGAVVRIDPTFAQPGVNLNMQITRGHLDRLEQTNKAIEKIFAAVPEL